MSLISCTEALSVRSAINKILTEHSWNITLHNSLSLLKLCIFWYLQKRWVSNFPDCSASWGLQIYKCVVFDFIRMSSGIRWSCLVLISDRRILCSSLHKAIHAPSRCLRGLCLKLNGMTFIAILNYVLIVCRCFYRKQLSMERQMFAGELAPSTITIVPFFSAKYT